MGRRGPKPEPAAVKDAKGNPGRRRVGRDQVTEGEAKATAATPAAVSHPSWLDKVGLEIWGRLAPRLMGQKLLTQLDAEAFARYCDNYARWLKARRAVNRHGETYVTESAHGKMRRLDPRFIVLSRLERELQAAEASFGLNPAERQRIFAQRAAGAGGGQANLPLGGDEGRPQPPATAAPAPAPVPSAPTRAVNFLN